MPPLTQALGELAASVTFDQLSPDIIAAVKRGVTDCIGVTLAAHAAPLVDIAEAVLAAPQSGPGVATVILTGTRTTAATAASLNGAAAHALDFDDTGLDGHPSVVLLAVALAEAERLQADGRRMIAAYAAGFEVWARLTDLEEQKIHTKGWHPSSTLGTIAAAAAAANIAGLTPVQATHALAIAASMAAGVVANFGSMMKPLQVGLAAGNGIQAAHLAAAGFTASSDALEHPHGLLAALSPAGQVRSAPPQAPTAGITCAAVLTHGINIKRYPMCYAMHRALDALAQVCVDHQIDAAAIRHIEFVIGAAQAVMLHQHAPQDTLEAKFSLEFGAACVALHHTVRLSDLTPAGLASAPLRALMARVQIEVDERRDADEPLFSPFDQVTVTLADGQVLTSAPVTRALGHSRRPIDNAALFTKFDDCSAAVLPSAALRRQVFERLAALESVATPAEIFTLLKQGCRPSAQQPIPGVGQ